LGIAGAQGKFILCEQPLPLGKVIPSLTLDRIENTGIMDASVFFDAVNNSFEEFTFCYDPVADSCIPADTRVTVRITKNVK
jgi:hypothetical protein